jgi:hypothetical protein
MMNKVTVLLMACLLAVGGCATSGGRLDVSDLQETERATMDSWLEHSKQELIQSWGPPTKTVSDTQGGEIWIYDKSVPMPVAPGQITPSPFGGVQYTTPQSLIVTRSRMFYISADGKVYHWRCDGRLGN